MTQPTQLSLSWQSFRNNVCEGLSSFQQNEEFVDMTLAADGHFVKVHKMVISLASPYLKELIKSAPCPHPVLFLNHISYRSLCSILEYIYSGEVVLNKIDVAEFMQAGKALHIKGLEVMDWNNSQVGGISSHITLTPDKKVTIDHIRVRPTENDQSPLTIQGQTRSHKLSNISNQASDPSVESNTYMDEHMDDAFQESAQDYHDSCHSTSANTNATPSLQYTLSNQGNIQLILNRYMYNLRYVYKNSDPPCRLWRCVEYIRNRCPASVTTNNDIVVQRKAAHKHAFHDKRILKKIQSGIILSAIKDAEERGKCMKKDDRLTSEEGKALEQIDTSVTDRTLDKGNPLLE